MDAVAPKIVHEAETQRQHVRVRLPIAIEINGVVQDVVDWSVAGLALYDPGGRLAEGEIFPARLIFPLADTEFSLRLRCEVRYRTPGENRVGCRFVDLGSSDLAVLQYLVGAYLSGELVQSGDVLAISSRQNFTRPRKTDADKVGLAGRLGAKVRRYATMAAVLGMAVALVAYVLLAIYQRMFIGIYNGYVGSEQTTYLRSPAIGVVSTLMLDLQGQVTKDAVVAAVTDEQGRRLDVRSPCDCVAVASPVPAGSVVQRGTPLGVLAPKNAALSVSVRLPIEKATGLKAGYRVSMATFNGKPDTRGTISRAERFTPIEYQTERGAPELQSYVVLTIQPDRPFVLADYAEPVRVKIDRLQLSAGRAPAGP